LSSSKVSRVLRSLEELAEKEFVPSIGPIKGRIITDIIRKYKVKNILEIGTLYGYSAILMAAAVITSSSDGKVVTIELDTSIADIARKNISKAELSDRIDVRVGNALEVISKLDLEFDLLFLDAAKNEYLKYLKLAEKKKILKEGAIIVADNVEVSKNDMLDYLRYVRNPSGIYKSYTIETTLEFTPDIKDAIEVSIKVAA
jgi:predicted O-methyltransferase YrrM